MAVEDLVEASDEQVVVRAFGRAEVQGGFADRVLARLDDGSSSQATVPVAQVAGEEDKEIAELLAAGARFAAGGAGGRSGMGMVIEYCSTCRERIDATDLKTGAAIQFKGQNYCATCKAEVLPDLEDDPEYIEQKRQRTRGDRRKSDRQPAAIGSGIRPGMGRAARHAPSGGGGPNMMMIGGVAAGVLALVVVGVIIATQNGGSSKPSRDRDQVAKKSSKGRKRGSRGKTRKKSSGDTGATEPLAPSKPSMEQVMAVRAAVKALKERFAEVEQFAQDNAEPERWQNVELKFKNLLLDPQWDSPIIKDDQRVADLRAKVEQGRKVARGRFETRGNDLISRAIQRATGFAMREDFGRAMQALDSVPPIFADLERYAEIAVTREKIHKKASSAMGDVGKWVDVKHSTWKLNPPSQIINGDDGATLLKGVGEGIGIGLFTPNKSNAWGDYEIEFEAKIVYSSAAKRAAQLGLRISRNNETRRLQGAAFTFKKDIADAYHKFHVKIEDQTITASIDGTQVLSSPAGGHWRGKPMLLVPGGVEVHVKSWRYKLLALAKR